MKESPILFSTSMVQAILRGDKTMTRRVVKPQPPAECTDNEPVIDFTDFNAKTTTYEGIMACWEMPVGKESHAVKCPYGQPGDRLWVRERFADGYNDSLDPNIGKPKSEWTLFYWLFADGSQKYSDGKYYHSNKTGKEKGFEHIRWRPSIHMPRAACRILLEIVAVRVERLQDISEEDAIVEGAKPSDRDMTMTQRVGNYNNPSAGLQGYSSKVGFEELWESINGTGSWVANPWVWVIEFRRVEI